MNAAYAQKKHIVEVSNNVFTPDELKINVGDTVEWKNIQGWHNVNGTKTTFPENPESFGNSTGNGWTYSYVFNTEGKYNYQCDPHVNFGMTGKIEVKSENDDDHKHSLTINFSGMNPHAGQNLYLVVYEKDSGKEVERKIEDISASLVVQVSGIEKDHSYYIDFFADHNGNGMYDAPPLDHAWRLELNNVTGDTILNFSHNLNFIDIELTTGIDNVEAIVNRMYPNPASNKVILDFSAGTKDLSIAIFDLTGKNQITEQYVGNDKVEVNLLELRQGVYFVQITKDVVTQTLKLIKK